MLSLSKPSPNASHDDLFIERYDRLLSWAIKLTDNNREMAEDLVQDAFVQFTFTRPELASILNLDAYLYGMLRHLHLSQVRRATRSRLQPLSIMEYESAETGLRSVDPRAQIQVQDELRHVCNYACVRKETAKVASVLILRFFHGYYPSEIVRLLRSSRAAVRERLRIARAEARLSLEDPKALGFIADDTAIEVLPTSFARSAGDFLLELRNIIFTSRRGECASTDQLQRLYSSQIEGIDCATLAHIVSCRNCLDATNQLLDLPLLSERYPTDSIDKETPGKSGKGGSDGGTTGGGFTTGSLEKCRRRARDTFEHDPQELCVSVNGYMQGSQKISSEVSELTLSLKDDEKISFIEVFSEQDVRLLFMSVDEVPPEGPTEQHMSVALSDTRRLDLTLRFRSPWPTVHVLYADPSLKASRAIDVYTEIDAVTPSQSEPERMKKTRKFFPVRLLRYAANGRFWMRPATVTTLFAFLLITVFLFVQLRQAPPNQLTATALLDQSAIADEAIAARTDTVIHRTVNLEERKVGGKVVSRRIEIWQSAASGITARRLFDEKGSLIAGGWRRADGVQTIYHHGTPPQLQNRIPQSAIHSFENVWQLSVSAKDFISLIGGSDKAHLEERASDYVLSYENGGLGIVRATLVLSKADLHATELTLVVSEPETNRPSIEYRFTEISFERRAPNTVAPAVFEPEAILSGAAATSSRNLPVSSSSTFPAPVLASRELEVEVLRLLNQAGADLGEQVSVVRAPEGFLLVQAIVDTDRRKRELQDTLGAIKNNPAVKLDISTRAEAAEKQERSGAQPQNVIIEESSPTANSIPVDAELRRYFAASGLAGEQLELNISRFSNRALNHSLQIMQHAWAIKRLAERFSPGELETLDSSAKSKWLSMIRGHAQALAQQSAMLQRELEPLFPSVSSGDVQSGAPIADDRELVQAAEQLFTICSESDRVIGAAFTISPETSHGAAIKGAQFWRSLKSAERLAGKIAHSQ